MFKQNIENILEDLKYHKRDKQNLLVHYIKKRLNASLTSYNSDMEDNYKSLIKQDARKTLAILARDK